MLLRRLLRMTCWTLLTAALLAPAARAADDVSGLSPQEVVSRFVAGVNARDPAAQKCALLTPGLRDLLVAPRWVGLDPRLPEAYSDENRLRSCDFFVAGFNGYTDVAGAPRWERTELDPPVTVEQTDALALLKVPLRLVHDDDGRPLVRHETADVHLRREPGGWKLVWPSLLWSFTFDDLEPAPATAADVPALLDRLGRLADERRGYGDRLVAAYLRTRAWTRQQALPWRSRGSFARDRLRDVTASGDEEPLADQRTAPGDLRAAALRTDGRTLTFELRFRDRLPARLYLSFDLQQSGPPARGRRCSSSQRHASWEASALDGWASAWVGDPDEPQALPGTRASVAGDALRIAFPARVVHGDVRVRRPLRWSLSATVVAPPTAPVQGFVDQLPARRVVDRTGGIVHPAGARDRPPACTVP